MSKISPPFLRPSVRAREWDLTTRGNAYASTYAAVTGAFDKGPMEPIYIGTGLSRFHSLYGDRANPTLSFAFDTVVAAATQTSNILVNRVVNGALHSGVHVYHDDMTDVDNPRPLFIPFVNGQQDNFSSGTK
ncbi:hypothetical protein KDA23_03280, partial [Candidatus Saccharibacteria bacterium]|nr:hypothetical protein [Candidatus Saccharibacteria bacterium]